MQIFSLHRFFFILNLHQHLMYSLDLKTVDKVVYRRENSSVQPRVGYDELAKIRSHPAGPVQALGYTSSFFFVNDCLRAWLLDICRIIHMRFQHVSFSFHMNCDFLRIRKQIRFRRNDRCKFCMSTSTNYKSSKIWSQDLPSIAAA